MAEAFVIDGVRTPIGRYGGALSSIRPDDLAAVNADGGAIALGHPLGASGTRLLVTLLGRMERENARLGLATMCVGVGQGAALLAEAV